MATAELTNMKTDKVPKELKTKHPRQTQGNLLDDSFSSIKSSIT